MDQYRIVVAQEPDVLEKKVNRLIDAGFIPSGGLTVDGCMLMQVMRLNLGLEIPIIDLAGYET